MAYSRITGTRNGADAIGYGRGKGKGHNNKKVRNMVISEVNMLPETVLSYEKQMQKYWDRASAKNKNQVRRVIQSFSKRELNPDDPNDIQKANEIGIEFAQRAYPGFQAVVFTQIDGESGLIHNHVLVNNVNMETYRGFTDEEKSFAFVKKWTNEVAGQYFELDTGQHTKDKTTQNERRKRQENERIREENKSLPPEKQKPLKYIWKDDLKERILKAAKSVRNYPDFFNELREHGVEAEVRTKRGGEQYIVYEFFDTPTLMKKLGKIPKNLKAKGHKLGRDYDIPHLDELFDKTWKQHCDGSRRWALEMQEKWIDEQREMEDFLYDFGGNRADFDSYKEYLEDAYRRRDKFEKQWKEERQRIREEQRMNQRAEQTKEQLTTNESTVMPAEKAPEKVQEAPKPKAEPVKKKAEKSAAKVPEKQGTKQRTRPRTVVEQLMIQKIRQRQEEEKKAKVEAQRVAFQKDERRLPDLSHIDWSKGGDDEGLRF